MGRRGETLGPVAGGVQEEKATIVCLARSLSGPAPAEWFNTFPPDAQPRMTSASRGLRPKLLHPVGS